MRAGRRGGGALAFWEGDRSAAAGDAPTPKAWASRPRPSRLSEREEAAQAAEAWEEEAAAEEAAEEAAAEEAEAWEEEEVVVEAEEVVEEGGAAAEEDGGAVGYIEAAWVPILAELAEAGLRPKGVVGASPLLRTSPATPPLRRSEERAAAEEGAAAAAEEAAAAAEGAAAGGGLGFIEGAWVPILGELVAAGLRPAGVRGFDAAPAAAAEAAAEVEAVAEEVVVVEAEEEGAGAQRQWRRVASIKPTRTLFAEERASARPLSCPPCPCSPRGGAAAEEEPPLTCAAGEY